MAQDIISPEEFREYIAWRRICDETNEDDYRAGVICATLCNVHRSRGTSAFTPFDFFRNLKRPERKRQRESDQRAAFDLAKAAFGRRQHVDNRKA